MTEDHRDSQDAGPHADAQPRPPAAPPAATAPVPAAAPADGAALTAAPSGAPSGAAPAPLPDGVDPFDYAEAIVRDLAQHVGARLRDLRQDLAAMHGAVVALPDTMKIVPLVGSVQELRERVAHLTGVVSHQGTRPAEEIERIGRGVGELARSLTDVQQRVGALEQWLSAARAAGGVTLPDLPPGPTPEALDRVAEQMHESLLRVVNAVRQVQLDMRDLRDEVRAGGPAAPSAAPAVPAALTDDLRDLGARLAAVEETLRNPPVATPTPESATGLAALLFGAWPRLAEGKGIDALSDAVREVLAGYTHVLGATVQLPATPGDSGLVAIATGRHRGTPLVLLVAVEDLKGKRWVVDPATGTLQSGDLPPRQPAWRALVAAAALAERAQPGIVAVPVLIHGNGMLAQTPPRQAILAYGTEIGAAGPARRLTLVAAGDLSIAGMIQPDDAAGNLGDVLLME